MKSKKGILARGRKPAMGLLVDVKIDWPVGITRRGTVIEQLSTQFTIIDKYDNVYIYMYTDNWTNAEEDG